MNGESLLFKQVKYFEVREKTHTLLQWRFDDFFLFVRAERIHGLISMLGAKCLFWTLQNVVTKVNMSITTSVKFMCATKSTCILHEKNTIFFCCCRMVNGYDWSFKVFFIYLFWNSNSDDRDGSVAIDPHNCLAINEMPCVFFSPFL